MSALYATLPRFQRLFSGFDEAHGHGGGGWIKRPPGAEDYLDHLEGKGKGLGIGPLRRDGTVTFAAIDLDEPDFAAAREFQSWLPGTSFVERSRSGNAHVWVFFKEPCEAWVAVGMLQYAIQAGGKEHVEVFPKQTSFDRVRQGNYINLPYHGDSRFMLTNGMLGFEMPLNVFLDQAERTLNDPVVWRKRAAWLQITDPTLRESRGESAEFGEQSKLHMCAEHVIEGVMSGERPILQGHKSVVYFNLCKQLANCSLWTREEIWEVMEQLAAASPDPPNMNEVARFLRNTYDKQYTSTGCDDPVFGPYAHPDCPIAHPRRTHV